MTQNLQSRWPSKVTVYLRSNLSYSSLKSLDYRPHTANKGSHSYTFIRSWNEPYLPLNTTQPQTFTAL